MSPAMLALAPPNPEAPATVSSLAEMRPQILPDLPRLIGVALATPTFEKKRTISKKIPVFLLAFFGVLVESMSNSSRSVRIPSRRNFNSRAFQSGHGLTRR